MLFNDGNDYGSSQKGNIMKKRIFGLILCVALLISSISVFAGTKSGTFGSGSEKAEAYLSANGAIIYARTSMLNGMDASLTEVRALGRYGSSHKATGVNYASTTPAGVDGIYAAESFHYTAGYSKYLTCSYN